MGRGKLGEDLGAKRTFSMPPSRRTTPVGSVVGM